ncbi:MAG TPA: hypothetical protein ACQGQI_10900, partial [Xylella sp.]
AEIEIQSTMQNNSNHTGHCICEKHDHRANKPRLHNQYRWNTHSTKRAKKARHTTATEQIIQSINSMYQQDI